MFYLEGVLFERFLSVCVNPCSSSNPLTNMFHLSQKRNVDISCYDY